MRLSILERGQTLGTKLLFGIIRLVTGQPVPEPMKVIRYRADFFGTDVNALTHEAMRGPSAWSVGDRELMAAVISRANRCEFCTKGHSTVAARAYGDDARVQAALADLDAAPIEAGLRATLRLLDEITREGSTDPSAFRAALDAGVSKAQLEDALAVALAFDVMNRLADTFEFVVPAPAGYEAAAKYLLARGYR